MATFNKFEDFVEQIARGTHLFQSHTYKVALTNTAPLASQVSYTTAQTPAPAAANGYTAGGSATTITLAEVSGTLTLQGTEVIFTAAGGAIGPFRYAILYNDTATTPVDAPVGFWDYGSSITLQDGEQFKVRFNNATPGTILTLS